MPDDVTEHDNGSEAKVFKWERDFKFESPSNENGEAVTYAAIITFTTSNQTAYVYCDLYQDNPSASNIFTLVDQIESIVRDLLDDIESVEPKPEISRWHLASLDGTPFEKPDGFV